MLRKPNVFLSLVYVHLVEKRKLVLTNALINGLLFCCADNEVVRAREICRLKANCDNNINKLEPFEEKEFIGTQSILIYTYILPL